MVTVYIDADPASLGEDATAADLDAYAQALANHLSTRFAVSIDVEPVLGGKRAGSKCPAREDIDDYVRDFEAGDGWLDLLGPRDDAPDCNCSQCPYGGPYTCTRED